MIRLFLTLIQIPLFAAFVLSTTHAAEPTLPPAPYRPLPVGTVLDYGSWRCTVDQGAEFEHVCRGPGGDSATFFGKFVPVGTLARSGYGAGLNEIWCQGISFNWLSSRTLEDVLLDAAARIAIRSLWPLEVGKEISFRRNFRPLRGKAKSKIKVVGTKTVSIAATDRLVFVLEGETERLWCRKSTVGFNEVWWYDPGLAAVVHYEIKWVDQPTMGVDFDYSLVKATFPQGTRIARAAPAAKPRPALPAPGPAIAADTAPPETAGGAHACNGLRTAAQHFRCRRECYGFPWRGSFHRIAVHAVECLQCLSNGYSIEPLIIRAEHV